MKTEIERRKPEGLLDYLSLAVTTFGVGYLPLAPGTWGSAVGVFIFISVRFVEQTAAIPLYARSLNWDQVYWVLQSANLVLLGLFCLWGIWAAGRSIELLGNTDPSEAVVDEVIGQLIVFLFVPLNIGWPFILAGFLLFRLFDIWKPYPIDALQVLPGGIGVCADDILAGVYAGICLSVIYAVSLSI